MGDTEEETIGDVGIGMGNFVDSAFRLHGDACGSFFDILHNSYVKGGLALGALLGPGRDVLLNDISGPDGNPLLFEYEALQVDVLV
ncbi:hypothetical protein IFM89_015275 [Coptis chinensis]|uniref:Uncharacterized protein n=1 Tax=Coptis chinensis TaxID=261450 RepID=A0A835LMP1_9MAGN|nr:hypothetical protein IFM89_015275 [Coptis chinensis]